MGACYILCGDGSSERSGTVHVDAWASRYGRLLAPFSGCVMDWIDAARGLSVCSVVGRSVAVTYYDINPFQLKIQLLCTLSLCLTVHTDTLRRVFYHLICSPRCKTAVSQRSTLFAFYQTRRGVTFRVLYNDFSKWRADDAHTSTRDSCELNAEKRYGAATRPPSHCPGSTLSGTRWQGHQRSRDTVGMITLRRQCINVQVQACPTLSL